MHTHVPQPRMLTLQKATAGARRKWAFLRWVNRLGSPLPAAQPRWALASATELPVLGRWESGAWLLRGCWRGSTCKILSSAIVPRRALALAERRAEYRHLLFLASRLPALSESLQSIHRPGNNAICRHWWQEVQHGVSRTLVLLPQKVMQYS